MDKAMTYQESLEKLRDLIKGIKIAGLVTRDSAGNLRSRPMTTQEAEFDGDLWFFTDRTTEKTDDLRQNAQVCVTYSSGDATKFVSISGRAELVDDRAKMRGLWSPAHKIWFPDGVEDPNLILIRVEAESGEYWEAPSNKIVQVAGLVKAAVTGEPADEMGENKELNLRNEDGRSMPSATR